MLRLINPPGHRPRRGWTFPRYATSTSRRNAPARVSDLPASYRKRRKQRSAAAKKAAMTRRLRSAGMSLADIHALAAKRAAAQRRFRSKAAKRGANKRRHTLRKKWLATQRVPLENPRRRRKATTAKRNPKTGRFMKTRRTTTVRRSRTGKTVKRTTVKRVVVKNPSRRRRVRRAATTLRGVRSMVKRKTVRRRRRVHHNPRPAVRRVVRRRRVRRNPFSGPRMASGHYYSPKARKQRKASGAKRRKARKHGPRSHASYVAAGKKAARTRKRNATRRQHPLFREMNRQLGPAPRRRRRTRKAAGRKIRGRVVKTLRLRKYTRNRKTAVYKVRRHRRGGQFRYSVRRNPLNAMKSMFMDGAKLYGGYVGAKLIGGLLQQYVFANASIKPTIDKLGSVASVLPSATTFLLAAFAGKVLPNQPKVVSAIQTGATLNLLVSIVRGVVLPQLASANLPGFVTGALSGIDDMGYGEYIQQRPGLMGEYIQQRPGLGAYVQEAMALDEYVQDGVHGFDVQEALADSEVQGMQSGFAAGSLARTTFAV